MKKKKIYEGRILGLSVYEGKIEGRKVKREYIEHRGAAAMLAFDEDKKVASYFMLLHQKPTSEAIALASEKVYENEYYQITEECLYYYSPKGMGKSKFNANVFEKKLEIFITTRNYKTMLKLLELSK